jgi:hypothetical protein
MKEPLERVSHIWNILGSPGVAYQAKEPKKLYLESGTFFVKMV